MSHYDNERWHSDAPSDGGAAWIIGAAFISAGIVFSGIAWAVFEIVTSGAI